MNDTNDYLPKSREYFRKFLAEKKADIFDIMREYNVGPGTGYDYFYRSDELVQCIRNIYHNLEETFGNLSIPGKFTSPKHLLKTWGWFYDYLIKEDNLIEEISKKLIADAKIKYKDEFENYYEEGLIFPEPFYKIANVHAEVKDTLEHILNMEEVKNYNEDTKKEKKEPDKTIEIKDGVIIPKSHNNQKIDIAIITAIYEPELRRVKEIIENPQSLTIDDDPTIYTTGIITKSDGSCINVIIASDDRMGMPSASTLATKLILNFNPTYLVMLGICAGIKGKVNEGDIIITELAWDYGSGKHEKVKTMWGCTKNVFKPYINQIQLDVNLESLLKNIIHQNKYVDQIKLKWELNHNSFPNQLKALIGPFASGSAVIANEDIVSSINLNHGKLLGFDMEAYSIFNSARYSGIVVTKPIVIKSVSDFGDSQKNNSNKDILQDYAAYTSAQYFLQIALNDLSY